MDIQPTLELFVSQHGHLPSSSENDFEQTLGSPRIRKRWFRDLADVIHAKCHKAAWCAESNQTLIAFIDDELGKSKVSDDEDEFLRNYFNILLGEETLLPADSVEKVYRFADNYINTYGPIQRPAWVAKTYIRLYISALILGENGRTFPFAHHAFSEATQKVTPTKWLKVGSIQQFISQALRYNFMNIVEQGESNGRATLYCLVHQSDQLLWQNLGCLLIDPPAAEMDSKIRIQKELPFIFLPTAYTKTCFTNR